MRQTSLQRGFCIDTSALIEMTTYPQDIFGGLWDDIGSVADNGLLISPKEVYQEIGREREENLQTWVRNHSGMFTQLDEDQFIIAQSIVREYPKLVDIDKTYVFSCPRIGRSMLVLVPETIIYINTHLTRNRYQMASWPLNDP